jgi:hypothetical protein
MRKRDIYRRLNEEKSVKKEKKFKRGKNKKICGKGKKYNGAYSFPLAI